jgi:ketol-acid reductoisomerase
MRTWYERDADLALIRSKRVGVLGFGAQGRAHALNLRDSGVDVTVGLRPGSPSREACEALGLETATPARIASDCDVVMMLVPDQAQPAVYAEYLHETLGPGSALMFAHGYNIHYGTIVPRSDLAVLMVAPLGIGDKVRDTYERGAGTPALLAVHADPRGDALQLGLSYAAANGHGRAGIIETSFSEETETDLFAEQAVLCGGLTHLITAAFDTLHEAGYPAELAYLSCLHEVKLMADMMHARGIAGMRRSISSTAEFGDYRCGPRIINASSRAAMRDMLAEIRSGEFARALAAEAEAGFPSLEAGRAAAEAHPIEAVGSRLRAMMPWLEG